MPRSSASGQNFAANRDNVPRGESIHGAAHRSLIDELEVVVTNRNIGSRADVLRRVTDLFVTGSDRFDDQQQALFEDIMSRLVEQIETSARAAFGERLARIPNAPPKVCRRLALDDSIEIAGPLLAHSDQLDDETLVSSANSKSQEHLLAISQRRVISEDVTDVLVERGNQKVLISTAANGGAQFSETGYSTLITRAEGDSELAVKIWARVEIPREQLLVLFSKASESVRLELEKADRGKAALIQNLVNHASDRIQTHARERSAEFEAARVRIHKLHGAGMLTEARLHELATAGMFDETVVAVALLSDLPIGAVERAFVHSLGDHMLVLAKSIGLSWDTTKAILLLHPAAKGGSTDELFARYSKLRVETARTAVQFYRFRELSTKAS